MPGLPAITIEQVRAFIEVAAQGNFSKAALSLGISQPAVSSRIKALEEEVGDKLLKRPHGTLGLTESGERFLPFVTRAMHLLDEGRWAVAEQRGESFRQMRVGAGPVVSTFYAAPLLRRIRELHPHAEVVLMTGSSQEVVEMVQSGAVHVGFARATKQIGISSRKVATFDLVPLAAEGHPVTEQDELTLPQLSREPHVLYRDGSTMFGLIRWQYTESGVLPNVVGPADSIEAVRRMVLGGDYVSYLPIDYVRADVDKGDLVVLHPAGATPLTHIVEMLWRTADRQTAAVRAAFGAVAIDDEDRDDTERAGGEAQDDTCQRSPS